MFSGYTMSPDSKETRYGTRSQKTSSSVDENTGVVLLPYWWKCDPTAFPMEWIFSRSLNVISYVRYFLLKVTKYVLPFFDSIRWPYSRLPLTLTLKGNGKSV